MGSAGDVGARSRSLFAFISADAMPGLGHRGRRRFFPRGCVLMRQGDGADAMYLITQGVVDILYTEPETGERTHLALLGEGEVVGEMGVLSGRPRSATVVAVNDVTALRFEREDVLEALAEMRGLPGPVRGLIEKRMSREQPAGDLQVVA